MIHKLLIAPSLLALFLAALAGTASAQTQVSPEMRQQAFKVARACRTDLKTYCDGVERGDGRIAACLRDNAQKLSSPCRSALGDVIQH
ncbi:cysteine rich repeat-containing protein [Neorhizobium galegae]|uniref:cysteine rich repeat-containing protein n=1 Tax=Neorhizobium galegae TaxID=399 RepID=UPI002101228D|nr:cysteine rich repeat-containing protein [Neorhizobium galegae]MCQ1574192.1 cysteine rich repeat-containing protein [Neorhizobium galegae]